MFTGAQQSLVRRLNDEMVCQNLRLHGPLSRAELARLGDVTIPAVLKMTNRLIEAGLVVEAGEAPSTGRGPRAQLFSLSPDYGVITTLHLQRELMAAAHWDLTGQCLRREDLPFDREGDIPAQVLAAAAPPGGARQAIVIGLPGAVHPDLGDVVAATELDHWRAGNARRIVEGTHALVAFDNEVNLRAAAEMAEGAATGGRDFLLLSLGQGLGATIVLDGRPLRGAHGAAGEIGFMVTGCEPRRTWQSMAGGWRLAELLGRRHTPDYAWAHELAQRDPHDPIWHEVARLVAPGVVSMIAVVDPPLVVLGGEVSRICGEPLRAAVEAAVAAELTWPAPEIRLGVHGDEGVLRGAHYRGWDLLVAEALGEVG